MGESNFMAIHYANLDGVLAILTKAEFFEAGSALLDNLRLARVAFCKPRVEPASCANQAFAGARAVLSKAYNENR